MMFLSNSHCLLVYLRYICKSCFCLELFSRRGYCFPNHVCQNPHRSFHNPFLHRIRSVKLSRLRLDLPEHPKKMGHGFASPQSLQRSLLIASVRANHASNKQLSVMLHQVNYIFYIICRPFWYPYTVFCSLLERKKHKRNTRNTS